MGQPTSTSPGKSDCETFTQGAVVPSAICLATKGSVVFMAPAARWQSSPAVTLCVRHPGGTGAGGAGGGVGGGVGGGAVGQTSRLSPRYTSIGHGRPPSVTPDTITCACSATLPQLSPAATTCHTHLAEGG